MAAERCLRRFPGSSGLLLLLVAVLLGAPLRCFAHPMGNFSINHYAGIRVERGSVEVRYIIDQAEIPTFQALNDAGVEAAPPPDPQSTAAQQLMRTLAGQWVRGVSLSVNGRAVALRPVAETILFPAGAGGLATMKIAVLLRGAVPAASGDVELRYSDTNFPGHAGWKEIVVSTGPGVALPPGVAGRDRSEQLSNYPTDLLNSPPQDTAIAFRYTLPPLGPLPLQEAPPALPAAAAPAVPLQTAGGKDQALRRAGDAASPSLPTLPQKASPRKASQGAAVPAPAGPSPAAAAPVLQVQANRQSTPRSRFTELMATRTAGPWFLLTAAVLALGLGAAHALEPGHGKTIVAAYLVGSRGRARHAVGLGLLVTAAHTAGVYLLGAVVLYASRRVVPEQVYPWLNIVSGLIIAVLAGYLFLRALTARDAEQTEVALDHAHWYERRKPAERAEPGKAVSLRQLLVLGVTGGIVPCPAALVVLLSAVALHRVLFGLYLIVAFSAGLAGVLIATGLLMVRGRGLVQRWQAQRGGEPLRWMRYVPMASAAIMFCAGLLLAAAALPALGWHPAELWRDHAGQFLAVVGLGLVLGMRHSTDADHVVAVSTIVSRERSVKQGALIGMMWGFGHTITIFVVGALIILFKLTIPPRLGLSMEMAVAGMLIVLGVLNLTGVLPRLTARWTPGALRTRTEDLELARLGGTGRGLFRRMGWYQMLRPLAIGLVHGLAGSAAVALLVLSMIRSTGWAVAYLVVFGLGTVVGMMLMTTAMAIPVALSGKRFTSTITVVSGVASVCFGLFLVFHIGFVDGLFTRHVHWTPE